MRPVRASYAVLIAGFTAFTCAACSGDTAPTLLDSGPVQSGEAAVGAHPDPASGVDGGTGSAEGDAALGGDASTFPDSSVAAAGDKDGAAASDATLDARNGAFDASETPIDASVTVDASSARDATAEASAGDAAPGPFADASLKQLALGRAHGCSLDPAISGVLCWGDGTHGQTRVPALQAPRFIAAGGDVSCAIEGSGQVRCWGDNTAKQLDVPAQLGPATQLAVGERHVCALNGSSRIQCWGDDSAKQLGAPTLDAVRAIGAGARHSCALSAQGVRCWGDDSMGQLRVPALEQVTLLAVGAFHSCAAQRTGVTCWGGAVSALRDDVPAVNEPMALASGPSHSCVIDRAGARCWGDPNARSLTPRELTWPRQIALGGGAGQAFACARHLQGVTCWGDASLGQTRYDGAPLHLLYRAESEIAASPAQVWSVLMDLPNYGAWNPYTIAMQSSLKLGDPMVMTVKMNSLVTLTQTEMIRVLEPDHKACWGIDTTTPELNSGERCQWLEPLADGGTRYVSEDLIEGTLNPLVAGLFDADLKAGFEGVARGLKARAEALARP